MPISLPTNPDGEQFEDLVVSALLVLGYFVEANMILSQNGKEILELDVIATPIGGGESDRILYEVKKQEFNFTNAFKLYGQMVHLNIKKGCLVSMRGASDDHFPVYEAKGKELGISMCYFPLDDETPLTAIGDENNSLPLEQKERLVSSLWFLNIARRVALSRLRQECKANRDIEEYKNAKHYLFASRSSFFQKSALGRAESLYKAYLDNPKLSGSLVTYLANQKLLDEKNIWEEARDTQNYLEIQCVMDLESLARFTILKNAFDDFLARGDAPPPSSKIKLGSFSLEFPRHNLPQSYYSGLEELKNHPHGSKAPYLFIVVYNMFGGFLFFRKDDELTLLSSITGIPVADILDCLAFLNKFFGDFFWTNRYDMMCMKGVPAFIRGAGCFFRQQAFDLKNYKDKYEDAAWLLNKWHNATYFILEPHLKKYVKK